MVIERTTFNLKGEGDKLLFGEMIFGKGPKMVQIKRRWNAKRLGPMNVASVPDVCGAYVILNRNGEVQYVGRSCELGARLEKHLREGTIPDARYFAAYQTDGEKSSKALERRLFRQHRPPYNKQEP
jgi:hypothetical protein